MTEQLDLLVEIGTEELPPTALRRLSEAFAEATAGQLREREIAFGNVEPFATPRRLALLIRDLTTRQPDQVTMRRGPTVSAAFTADGRPTPAAEGFARSCGVAPEVLERDESDKGSWLVFRQSRAGEATQDLILPIVETALARLPIAKRMRWGTGEAEFVRPVHWACILFGRTTVSGSVLGLRVGNSTRGHRFHAPGAITVSDASRYPDILRAEGRVEPCFDLRREMIRTQVTALAHECGGRAVLEDDLLDEVTALCEWPTAVVGGFDEKFLTVPPEVLIETMQKHQKYFAVLGPDDKLLPRFITVSNIESREPGQVRAGNERVIRPRFADAAFFWEQDRRKPLEAYRASLEKVVFQERLGSIAEKSARTAQISRLIAASIGQDEELADRAAKLAKCDLMTQMIFEFPSLQGVMGRYYAEAAGEEPCVCAAMEEQYLPRHAGDRLPDSHCGQILAVADKVDTLVGIFAIGQRPTGVKDPYALRRTAIGLLRILIETPLELDLRELFEFAAGELRGKVEVGKAADEALAYVLERLKGYYQEQNIGNDVVDAVLAVGVTAPSDIHQRILAVEQFRALPAAAALTAANKRIRNILRKAEEPFSPRPDPSALTEDAERVLADQVFQLETHIAPMLETRDYEAVLNALAGLREDVDTFFDAVMVMVEDEQVRKNRLALLRLLESLFLRVADISRLQSV